MMYRFSSSFFALLLCMELGASPSLKAMKEDLDLEEKKKVQIRKKLFLYEDISEIEKIHNDLALLPPYDLGDIEYELSENLFKLGKKTEEKNKKLEYYSK